jgi:APA family basic amino acid/polyamine antiporter
MWGSWAARAIAAGAAISCFGALNGWILLQGQIPLAAALDGLLPPLFGRLSARGTPVVSLVVSSALVTLIVGTNYTRGLVAEFTFIILLATLTTLVPYVFSTAALVLMHLRERNRLSGAQLANALAVALLALLYSLWAIVGSGGETIFWGGVLLLAGVPVYVGLLRARSRAG